MKKKMITLMILMNFTGLTFAADPEVLTLKAAQKIAYENSNRMKSMEINSEIAKKSYDQAKWNRSDAQGMVNFANDKADGSVEQAYNQYASASRAEEIAENSKDDAEKGLEDYEIAIDYEVESIYTAILFLEDQYENKEKQMKLTKANLDFARIKRDMGIITEDQYKKELEKSNKDEIELKSIKINLESARSNLKKTLGYEYEKEILLEEYEVKYPKVMPKRETLFSRSESEYYEFEKLYRDYHELEDDARDTTDYTSQQIKEYQADLKRISIDEEEFDFKKYLNGIYDDYELKKDKLDSKKADFDQASKDYEEGKAMFELGMITQNNLDGMKLKFEVEEDNLQNASYDLLLAEKKVKLAEKGIIFK